MEVRSKAKNIYSRCLRHLNLTKVTIDSTSLIAVAEINSYIKVIEVIIIVIISSGDSIAVGNAR
jgi:hypothetical protein